MSPASDPKRPSASSPEALRRMRNQRRVDTACELALRKALWHKGFRYRVDYQLPLPGLRRRADIAFPTRRIAVFVDGCFWHRCPRHGTSPAANGAWWSDKLDRNVARDRDTDVRLQDMGWTVVRVWEHESATEATEAVLTALASGSPD